MAPRAKRGVNDESSGVPAPRFRRALSASMSCKGGGWLRSAWTQRPGEFLAHLWPLFGEPEPCDDGFLYALEDAETGAAFHAYSGASGPSYRGEERAASALDLFEKLVRSTPPSECEFVFTSFDAGALPEKVRVGWKGGEAYARPAASATRSARVKTPTDCERRVLAIADKLKKRYRRPMLQAAWNEALQKAISPPEELEWKGRTFENVVAVMLGKRGKPVVVVDEGDDLEELPLAEALADDPVARLWCEAYEAWRKKNKRPRKQAVG